MYGYKFWLENKFIMITKIDKIVEKLQKSLEGGEQ